MSVRTRPAPVPARRARASAPPSSATSRRWLGSPVSESCPSAGELLRRRLGAAARRDQCHARGRREHLQHDRVEPVEGVRQLADNLQHAHRARVADQRHDEQAVDREDAGEVAVGPRVVLRIGEILRLAGGDGQPRERRLQRQSHADIGGEPAAGRPVHEAVALEQPDRRSGRAGQLLRVGRERREHAVDARRSARDLTLRLHERLEHRDIKRLKGSRQGPASLHHRQLEPPA